MSDSSESRGVNEEDPYRTSMNPRVAHVFRGSATFVVDLREVVCCLSTNDKIKIVFRNGCTENITRSAEGLPDALEAYLKANP